MILHAPQIIYLALTLIGTGLIWAKHGTPKTGDYNIVTTLIGEGIIVGLLYWGGFFG